MAKRSQPVLSSPVDVVASDRGCHAAVRTDPGGVRVDGEGSEHATSPGAHHQPLPSVR